MPTINGRSAFRLQSGMVKDAVSLWTSPFLSWPYAVAYKQRIVHVNSDDCALRPILSTTSPSPAGPDLRVCPPAAPVSVHRLSACAWALV